MEKTALLGQENLSQIKSNEIDLHVGQRLKKRRERLGLKQNGLAKQLNVSYQQIQKYEKGENKIPAGRLYQIAQILRVDIDHFFIGLEKEDASSTLKFLCTERTTPLNILLVEDDSIDQMLTRNALEACDFDNRVYIIHDGEAALDFLRHRVNEDFPRPDIILLDLNIPRRDGFYVLRELNRDKELKDIPTIVLTNSNDPEHMYRGYQHNISGYVAKTHNIENYYRNIAVLVEYWSAISILPSMQNS